MSREDCSFFCSDRLGRMILNGMEEVMGQTNVDALLACAGPSALIAPGQGGKVSFQSISRLQSTLEELYGKLGGHGLALRSGRASVKYGLKELDQDLGFAALSFRLLPLNTRIKNGIAVLANAMNRLGDYHVSLESEGPKMVWKTEDCPMCWNRQAGAPVCHHTVGFLQEFLYTISAGKTFLVTETECIATKAPACKFTIDMQAIE